MRSHSKIISTIVGNNSDKRKTKLAPKKKQLTGNVFLLELNRSAAKCDYLEK